MYECVWAHSLSLCLFCCCGLCVDERPASKTLCMISLVFSRVRSCEMHVLVSPRSVKEP